MSPSPGDAVTMVDRVYADRLTATFPEGHPGITHKLRSDGMTMCAAVPWPTWLYLPEREVDCAGCCAAAWDALEGHDEAITAAFLRRFDEAVCPLPQTSGSA